MQVIKTKYSLCFFVYQAPYFYICILFFLICYINVTPVCEDPKMRVIYLNRSFGHKKCT